MPKTTAMWVMVVALAAPGCIPLRGCDEKEPAPEDLAMSVRDLSQVIGGPCNPGDVCGGGGTCCGGTCVDLFTNAQNCGGCGIACPSGACVKNATGYPYCACDADAGTGCSSALEPTCNSNGHCVCGAAAGGGESGVCGPRYASTCSQGACKCGNEAACSGLSDHCDPALTPSCRCAQDGTCDSTIADRCDPTSGCKCGSGAACTKGAASCCSVTHECCTNSQYCCLDGCCSHPCLLLGFCAQ